LTLLSQFLFKEWNKKFLGKKSISLFPGENSQLKNENKGRTSLNLLLMSMIGPLIFEHCLGISYSNEKQWGFIWFVGLVSIIEVIMWFASKRYALR